MKATTFVILAVLVFVLVFVTCNEQVIDAENADAPFRDQKDKARLETCIGECLDKYPAAKEFIMKHSWSL
jgi:uncharacterized membrane protein